jgi:hypothetical protein
MMARSMLGEVGRLVMRERCAVCVRDSLLLQMLDASLVCLDELERLSSCVDAPGDLEPR